MSDYKEHLDMIPKHMHGAMLRYIEDGISPGSFLEAVLCNDLKETFMRADMINSLHIKSFVEYIYWHIPSACQGSQELYNQWCTMGGLKGRVDA